MTAVMHAYTGGQDPHSTTPVTQHRDFAPHARLGDPKIKVGTGEKTHEAATTVKPSPSADGQILLCAIRPAKHYSGINRSTGKKATKDI